MAGKKRRSNAARKAQYATRKAGLITDKNKKRRQETHTNAVAKQKVRTDKTSELFDKVCNKYELNSRGKYALKRLIGTVNAHRLTCVLDNTVKEQSWYPKRYNHICPVNQKASTGDTIVRMDTNASKLIRDTKLRVFL